MLPCHNEADNLERTLIEALAALPRVAWRFELVVVDDGSTDGCAAVADRLAQDAPVRVIRHEHNRGYGAAVRSGLRATVHEVVCYCDADGQFALQQLEELVPLIAQYDVVSPYRCPRADGPLRRFAGTCWNWLVCRLLRVRLRDVNCGFKLFRRPVLQGLPMQSDGAGIAAELLIGAHRAGRSIVQPPVQHRPRRGGRASGLRPRVVFRGVRELLRLRAQIPGAR